MANDSQEWRYQMYRVDADRLSQYEAALERRAKQMSGPLSAKPPERVVEKVVEKRVLPPLEDFAMALWLEDGDVERHIEERYDVHFKGQIDPARLRAARATAWARNDLGKQAYWTSYAERALEWLSEGKEP